VASRTSATVTNRCLRPSKATLHEKPLHELHPLPEALEGNIHGKPLQWLQPLPEAPVLPGALEGNSIKQFKK